MNLLVTGGAGFVGSHFVRSVLTGALPGLAGAHVTVLDKLAYGGSFANLGPVAEHRNLDFVPGVCGDAAMLDVLLPRHDTVVHFASTGAQVLLEAALRHGTTRFVQVSSDEVYGSIEAGAWTERSPLTPTTPYAAAQAGADLLALAYHRTHGLPVVVTRGVSTYGPYQRPDSLVPKVVTGLLAGRTVPLPGDGGQMRDWVHVDDHCRGIALALLEGTAGEVYHVGGDRALTSRALADMLVEACRADPALVVTGEDREELDQRRALDDKKIRQALGYRPRVGFEAGLAMTVQWYRDNEEWWRPQLTD
jgi:dTDP-glucose 4,6-dehydratase